MSSRRPQEPSQPPEPETMVSKADLTAFYSRAAAAGVYAPLDPGELDSMEARFAAAVLAKEPSPDKVPPREITLTRPWLAEAERNGLKRQLGDL